MIILFNQQCKSSYKIRNIIIENTCQKPRKNYDRDLGFLNRIEVSNKPYGIEFKFPRNIIDSSLNSTALAYVNNSLVLFDVICSFCYIFNGILRYFNSLLMKSVFLQST